MNISNNCKGLRVKFVDHRKIEFQQSKLIKVCAGCGWLFNPTRSRLFCRQCHVGLVRNARNKAILRDYD